MLVDAEGAGALWVHRSDPSLTVVREVAEPDQFPLLFRDSIFVSTSEPGEFIADVVSEWPAGLEAQPATVAHDAFTGCGWLVGGCGECVVDERFEPIVLDGGPVRLPFFRSIRGKCEFHVVPDATTECVLADALDIGDEPGLSSRDWTVQNMSRLRELDSCFEDGTRRRAEIASHLNAATWVSPIPPHNRGIRIRKLYDRFHGRQRARVKIDGEAVGVWYEPREDRERRWAVAEFGVPAEATRGKSEIAITIDPYPGTALWSVSRIEVWVLVGRARS